MAALPFIVSDGGGYRLTEEARELLESIKDPVAVVAVAGLYRTGKSFLLNRLVGSQQGFVVGSTVEACTKGLHIHSKPMDVTLADGTTAKVLFVDTEGFGASTATQDSDARLFSLATLLCSLLIYNSVGAINEEAITNVAFIADLSKHIQTRTTTAGAGDASPGAADGSTGLPAFFPAFLWVLRDFVLDLKDEDGETLTPRDYLELSLSEQAGFTAEKQQRNRVRRAMTRFFRHRDCRTLVRPVTDETVLQELDKHAFSELRPEFRTAMTDLREHVLHGMLRPKKLFGRIVTGRMLAGLAAAYVHAINHDAVPSIGDAWTDVARAECKEAAAAALSAFRRGLKLDAPPEALPMEEHMLEEIFRRVRAEAIALYDSAAVGESAGALRKEMKASLAIAYDTLVSDNEVASRKQCAELLEKLGRTVVEPNIDGGHGYKDPEVFREDLASVVSQFDKQARGPAKLPELVSFVSTYVGDAVAKVSVRAAAEAEKREAELVTQVAAADTARAAAEDRATATQKELADVKVELAAAVADKSRFEMEAQVAQDTVGSLRRKMREAEVETRRLEDELMRVEEDAKDREAASKLLETKLEARAAEAGAMQSQVEQLHVAKAEAEAAAAREKSRVAVLERQVGSLQEEVRTLAAAATSARVNAEAEALGVAVQPPPRTRDDAQPPPQQVRQPPPQQAPQALQRRPLPAAAPSGGDDSDASAAGLETPLEAPSPADSDADSYDAPPPPEWTRRRHHGEESASPPQTGKSPKSPHIMRRPATPKEAGASGCCCVVS